MSRSYKKYPKVKTYYGKSGKFSRTIANRKIRRLPIDYDIPNGRGFKKITESYDIWDYSCTQFKEWEIQSWYTEEAQIANDIYSWKRKYHTTLEETLNDWKKFYLSK